MTFDLEKVQAAIEEAVDRLNQKIDDEDGPIWEKEPEKAAVLQTLLAEITHLEKWVIKNRDIATDLQYQLDDEVKENERLLEALDESEKVVAHKTKSAAHWYDEHLRAQTDLTQSKRVIEQQVARIKELEDAHKRSGKKYAKIINELRSSVYANIPGLDVGKIGPDATKPRSWQITEERKAAIDHGLQFLEWSYAKNSALDTKEQIAVLWAMLDEVGQ